MADRIVQTMERVATQYPMATGWVKHVAAFLIPASCGFLTARILDNYRAWLAMGPGGMPANPMGYLINAVLNVAAPSNDTRGLAIYDKPNKYSVQWEKTSEAERVNVQSSFLRGFDLPERRKPWAKALDFNIPQRQRNAGEWIDETVQQAYLQAFDKLVDEQSDVLEWRISTLEKRGQAIFLKQGLSIPTPIAGAKGEICHIHPSDLSAHVTLSFPDAKEVISKGWGERHRLSGTAFIPLAYTMLHIPRSLDEIGVFIGVFKAGIAYALSNVKKE